MQVLDLYVHVFIPTCHMASHIHADIRVRFARPLKSDTRIQISLAGGYGFSAIYSCFSVQCYSVLRSYNPTKKLIFSLI